jgi:hypothetical protein
METAVFHALSIDLTGEPHLDVDRAEGLLHRLRRVADPQVLERLAETAAGLPADAPERHKAIDSRIMGDPALRELAKAILVLWYTGDWIGETPSPPTEDQYFGALIWPLARAHPPALSGGYFGHWTYPPDN